MPTLLQAATYQTGHVSAEARLFTLLCGLALFCWSLVKLRRRSALVPTCSLFLTVGLIFISFAISPNAFDQLSYMFGIKYPPILYLTGCVLALILMIVHLAGRLSSTDERCRRLAQEIALLQIATSVNSTARLHDAAGHDSPPTLGIVFLQAAVSVANADTEANDLDGAGKRLLQAQK